MQVPINNATEGQTYTYITIYGYKQVDGVRTNDVPENTFHKKEGVWHAGDWIALDIDVPKEFSDGLSGRVLRIGLGDHDGYNPSPNLLLGQALK